MRKISLFTISYLLYLLALFVQHVNFSYSETAKQVLILVSVGCLFLYLVSSKLTVTKLRLSSLIWGVIFVGLLAMSIYTRDFFILAMLLFCMASKENDYKKIFKYTCFAFSVCTIIIIVLSLIGVLPNEPIVRDMYNGYGYGESRYAFGFKWPLVIPNILVYFAICRAIYKNHISMTFFLGIQTLGLFFLHYCDSRSGFVSLEITLIAHFICNYINKHKNKFSCYIRKIVCVSSRYTFPVISILSIILLNLYREWNPWAYMLNIALSNRLKWASLAFDSYTPHVLNISGFSVFRESVPYIIDSGYYYIILRYGYIMLLLLSVICYKLSRYFENKNNYYGMVAIVIISIMNFVDNSLTSYGYFPLLITGLMLVKNDYKNVASKNKGKFIISKN